MFTYLSYSVWTKNVNSPPIPPNGSSLHHCCARNWGCGNLGVLEFTERLLDRRSCFRRVQVGNPQIAHRCFDVFVTEEILDGLNLGCTRKERSVGASESVQVRVERASSTFCDSLHGAKQVLIRVPCTIWENEFAAGILPLALGNRCDKVLRNQDATEMPMLGMPLEVWLVHDV